MTTPRRTCTLVMLCNTRDQACGVGAPDGLRASLVGCAGVCGSGVRGSMGPRGAGRVRGGMWSRDESGVRGGPGERGSREVRRDARGVPFTATLIWRGISTA